MEHNDRQSEDLCTDSKNGRWVVVPLLMEAEDNFTVLIVNRNDRDYQECKSCQVKHSQITIALESILRQHNFKAQIEAKKSYQARENRRYYDSMGRLLLDLHFRNVKLTAKGIKAVKILV